MSAFGDKITCNLCIEEGKVPFTTFAEKDALQIIELHTRTEHLSHVEYLLSGGIYRPLIPSPIGGGH